MTRRLAKGLDRQAQAALDALLTPESRTTPQRYRAAMREVGVQLGHRLVSRIPLGSTVYLVCTVEDADFLARGALESLEAHLGPDAVSLACFWNLRDTVGPTRESVAPIVHRYEEPLPSSVDVLVVLKSIISGGCTVRTNLQELIHRTQPKSILIAAPVVHVDAPRKLAEAFLPDTSSRFDFVFLAEDDERSEEGIVTPGIGGNVYELLGFADQPDKNRYVPELLASRP